MCLLVSLAANILSKSILKRSSSTTEAAGKAGGADNGTNRGRNRPQLNNATNRLTLPIQSQQ